MKKIVYVFLIMIIIGISFTVYATLSPDTEKIEKEKKMAELRYLEGELENIFNELNNIKINNHNISVNNITKKNNNDENKQEDNSSNSKNSINKNNTSTNDSENNNEQKEFTIDSKGILNNKDIINWNDIKNQIETLYSTIPSITIDLYQSNIDQDDILNFNKEFDDLTVLIKNENKEKILENLSNLYGYIVKFSNTIFDKESDKLIIKTKNSVLKAYSKLEFKNWEEISNDIKEASDIYYNLLTDTSVEQNKHYSISKVYVMINELQNAIQIQDESVFLIKYKNLMEEINILNKET